MILMNKKGVLGKAFVSVPVMILIFVILLIYLFLSLQARGFNDPDLAKGVGFVGAEESIFLKVVDLSGEKVTVFDKYVAFKRDPKLREDFQTALELVMLEEGGEEERCLYIYQNGLASPDRDLIRMRYYEQNGRKLLSREPETSDSKDLVKSKYPNVERVGYGGGFNSETFLSFYVDKGKIGNVNFDFVDSDGSSRGIDSYSYFGKCLGGEK